MARNQVKPEAENPEIPMTPMIDVVFQLLIYFIVTMKPVDVVAHLDVFRPSAEARKETNETPPRLIKILVLPDGYTINDTPVGLNGLEKLLDKLGAADPSQTVLITCGSLSPHRGLVRVLDLCSKAGLNNLSVLSAD